MPKESARINPIVRIKYAEGDPSWTDNCVTCKHTRADHVVDPRAITNPYAVSNCNVLLQFYATDMAQSGEKPDYDYDVVKIKDNLLKIKCGCAKFE